jgi:hypothetical protein
MSIMFSAAHPAVRSTLPLASRARQIMSSLPPSLTCEAGQCRQKGAADQSLASMCSGQLVDRIGAAIDDVVQLDKHCEEPKPRS